MNAEGSLRRCWCRGPAGIPFRIGNALKRRPQTLHFDQTLDEYVMRLCCAAISALSVAVPVANSCDTVSKPVLPLAKTKKQRWPNTRVPIGSGSFTVHPELGEEGTRRLGT